MKHFNKLYPCNVLFVKLLILLKDKPIWNTFKV